MKREIVYQKKERFCGSENNIHKHKAVNYLVEKLFVCMTKTLAVYRRILHTKLNRKVLDNDSHLFYVNKVVFLLFPSSNEENGL